jgi:transposase
MNNPLYLGVDDRAFRKRLKYRMILVDLATHKPIELLPDRETKTFANWLRNHPGILVISRDRSSAYIEAINQGAPDTIQVADRWYLLHNLVQTIERVLTRRYKEVKSAYQSLLLNEEASPELEPEAGLDQSEDRNPLQPSSQYDRRRQQVREKHQVQFDEIRELHRQGAGIREISRRLHGS